MGLTCVYASSVAKPRDSTEASVSMLTEASAMLTDASAMLTEACIMLTEDSIMLFSCVSGLSSGPRQGGAVSGMRIGHRHLSSLLSLVSLVSLVYPRAPDRGVLSVGEG